MAGKVRSVMVVLVGCGRHGSLCFVEVLRGEVRQASLGEIRFVKFR
jgi:tRNA A37 methylthiotransferase MiaB